MICSRRKSLTAGFTIYEMLIAVMLLVLVGGLAVPFTVRVVKSMHGAQVEATANARFDNAINTLRNDVWQATEIHLVSNHHLLLTRTDQSRIEWNLTGDQHLQQQVPNAIVHDWGTPGGSMEFAQDGSTLRVTVADMPHFHGGSFCMVSPLMLAGPGGGGHP